MEVQEKDLYGPVIIWKLVSHTGEIIFEGQVEKETLTPGIFSAQKELPPEDAAHISATAVSILKNCRKQHPHFLKNKLTTTFTHTLEFPAAWGLGSSSTLINNMAQYAGADAFAMNREIFGGSGYDIACARSERPVLYKIDDEGPIWDTVNFIPPQKEQIFFIYLGKKVNSQDAVKKFREAGNKFENEKEIISEITEALLFCDDFPDFMTLLDEHEEVMQFVLQEEKVKTKLFRDFPGIVKSLGAWGGDFVMAAADLPPAEIKKYFHNKGYTVIMNYDELVLFR